MQTPTKPATKLPGNRLAFGGVCCLTAAVILGYFGYVHYRGAAVEPTQSVLQSTDKKGRPVILLTGFEPFGPQKPANPSWEGIKALDGTTWNGYQLVCKQLPVVWGAPLQHLQELIEVHQPVAIFSFGQGGEGSFTVESKAANERHKKAPDNTGARAPTPYIVEKGAAEFAATANCAKFARLLSEKGYETRVSTQAGKYLCEETLYTLEHLKAAKNLDASVMFCHVPPLDSTIGKQKITAEYVQQFVQEVLVIWQDDKTRQQDTKDVKEFVGRYFRTWSEQDMNGYDACFLSTACIQHIDSEGDLTTTLRPEFIKSQRDYHKNSPHKTTEVAESIDIRFEEKLARVVVFWKLTAGPRTDYGYDHFTLIKVNGRWRIVNLVFYGAPAPGAKKAD